MSLERYSPEEREARILALKEKNEAFTYETFGIAEKMPTDAYAEPPFDAAAVPHPRLFLNNDTIPTLKRLFAKDATDESVAPIRELFWKYADRDDVTNGFSEVGEPILYRGGTRHAPDGDYYLKNKIDKHQIASLEAKALAYLITGDELYALEAILGAKNAILTLRFWDNKQQDTYWGAAILAAVVARIYDWCYPTLSGTDRLQIIGGVRTKLLWQLEFNYPPSNLHAVSGHGTGRQFFIDYLSLAIAFANERPDWWSFVGGRFYQEYIPVVNAMYSSGFISQGTYYGTRKWYWHLASIYMLNTLGDTAAFSDGAVRSAYTAAAHIMPNKKFIQTGENSGWKNHYPDGDGGVGTYWLLLSAALTKNPDFLTIARNYSPDLTKLDIGEYQTSPAILAIFAAASLGKPEKKELDLPTIVYNGYPGGQTIIRKDWSENSPYVLMKILDKTMANHEHRDSGTFQIYYKGLLACDSGIYKGVLYGKEHWKHYLQATVAHNGMLVYDAAYRDTLPEAERKYYSGSQRHLWEASTIEKWNSGQYDFAKILGHAECEGKFAYISGNTTNAYVAETVDYVKRSMLTVLTDNEDIPMLFFVYDDVTSKNEEAIKKFLLHTVNEPTLEGNTVTVTQDGGKLTLTSLLGADKIEKIGGEGKEFWVGEDAEHGYNVTDAVESLGVESLFGRVELSATGRPTDKMLNVIYVTDKDSSAKITPILIETDKLAGAYADGVAALFAKSRDGEDGEIEFTLPSDAEVYVSGLADGKWSVTGGFTGEIETESTSDGTPSGLIRFTASAGRVSLKKF